MSLEEEQALKMRMDDLLTSLHAYYILSQLKLREFDKFISHQSTLGPIYHSDPYLGLVVLKSQISTIENEIEELWGRSRRQKTEELFIVYLKKFSQASKLQSLSLQNIVDRLNIPSLESQDLVSHINDKELEKAYRNLIGKNNFHVFEKNIEHLSYLLSVRIKKNHPSKNASSSDERHWEIGLINSANPHKDPFFNVDALDWPPQNVDTIVNRVKALKNKMPDQGGVIIFHADYGKSAEAFKLLSPDFAVQIKKM